MRRRGCAGESSSTRYCALPLTRRTLSSKPSAWMAMVRENTFA
jgi:hypothetical protein